MIKNYKNYDINYKIKNCVGLMININIHEYERVLFYCFFRRRDDLNSVYI